MLVAHESVHATSGQSDPWKRTMAVFKDAGVVVTTPSSGTYVIECIGNVGVLADMKESLYNGGLVDEERH